MSYTKDRYTSYVSYILHTFIPTYYKSGSHLKTLLNKQYTNILTKRNE